MVRRGVRGSQVSRCFPFFPVPSFDPLSSSLFTPSNDKETALDPLWSPSPV